MPGETNQNPAELETALREVMKKLEESRGEVEAHEGLLRMALDDMRRFYDDLQKSQTQLAQADKLAAIGLLTAGIVHEINNPLGVVVMAMSLLKSRADSLRKLCEGLPAAEREKALTLLGDTEKMVQQSADCADRMAAIVKDIRMFSRTDKGLMNAENVNTVIGSVLNIVWNAVKSKIELKKEFGELPPVRSNAQQLSQVFMNLIVNASQAMNGKGVITIRTRATGNKVAVDISDSGPGIPDEVKARLFEAFFTTKGPEKGTGLGLSISRDIVRKHGGEIEVESQAGKGTTFTVTLPVNGPA